MVTNGDSANTNGDNQNGNGPLQFDSLLGTMAYVSLV